MKRASVVVAFALVVGACNGDGASSTTSSSTTTTTTTTTTTMPTTTTTVPTTTTTTLRHVEIGVNVDDAEARRVVAALYGWIGDPSQPVPDIPQGLADQLATIEEVEPATLDGAFHWADVSDGRVGLVTIDDDVILLADEGDGWTVVGAWLPRYGLDPWFGAPERYVLVIGTDARPGQDQQNFRADSIHILSSNLANRSGGILGFPRDSYVEASYGFDKFTHVNVYGGQQDMVDTAAELSGLPVEGYIITGFLNFQRLINDFGGVWVDVPFGINDWRAQAYMSAGYQLLWGDKALGFSRTRRISGGDFKRSFHQGVVIMAGLEGVLDRDMTALPALIAILDMYTWTDLSLGDLLTLGATAFLTDPGKVGNRVLPGTVEYRGGASVVVLSEEGSEEIFRDMDDGDLTPEE